MSGTKTAERAGASAGAFHLARFKITSRHAASAVAVAASLYFSLSQLENDKRRQERDVEMSSSLLADGLREAVEPLLESGAEGRLRVLVERFGRRGRLAGIAVYGEGGKLIAGSRSLLPRLNPPPPAVAECLARGAEAESRETAGGTDVHVHVLPLHRQHGAAGALAVFHDMSFIEARQVHSQLTSARRLVLQGALFVLAVWAFGLLLK